jgi:hypothetical protein
MRAPPGSNLTYARGTALAVERIAARSLRLEVRLGLTLIYVEDFPAMFAFYRDVLGLETTDEDPGAGHDIGID